MPRRDGIRDMQPFSLLEPETPVADDETAGLDTRGANAATILVHVGGTVDAGFLATLEDSDDDITYAAVGADDVIGDTVDNSADTVFRLGYVGNKRYVRAALIIPGATDVGVVGLLTKLHRTPEADL